MGADVRDLAPEYPVVEARFFGRVTVDDLTRAYGECLTIALETDRWLLLADCTDLLWSAPMSDLKELMDGVASLGVSDRFREALIAPSDVTAGVYVNFWETAGVNRGLDVRTFRTRDEALAWLAS